MGKSFHLQQCQLCDDFAILKDSHIAPNFMERYVKSVSLTKQFTHSENFNLDSQSAYKRHFLCFNCEQKFGVWETEFAKHIFWPWVKDGQIYKDKPDWSQYFLASITWRFGRFHERKQATLNDKCQVCTSTALQSLRDYLIGNSDKPGAFAPRLFYSKVEDCEESDEGAIGGATPLFDYMIRSYEQQIAIGTEGFGLAMYIKLPHFAIWHTVEGPEWIIDDQKIMEIADKHSKFYALRQAAETTQASRDRRNKIVSKKSPRELQDFYSTSAGDNVRRAQQFMYPLEAVNAE